MDEFELELKNGFLEEATQLQSEVEQCFLSLEANPNDQTILEKIFRLAHNIKGSSKAVGFAELGAFTHEFESFILKLKNGEIKIDHRAVDLLLAGNDHLRQYFDALRADLNATLDSRALVASFLAFRNEDSAVPDASAFPEESFVSAEPAPLSPACAIRCSAPSPPRLIRSAPSSGGKACSLASPARSTSSNCSKHAPRSSASSCACLPMRPHWRTNSPAALTCLTP